MAATATPVVFVHGLWLHADSWSGWIDRFRDEGYEPQAPGWPGDAATVEETRKGFRPRRRVRHRRAWSSTTPRSSRPRVEAGRRRPLVRRPDRAAAARPEPRRRRGGDRPGADQGCAPAAALGAARGVDRAAQPGQPQARRLAHRPPVPVRVRQPVVGDRVERALRAVDDPVAGAAAVRGRERGLLRQLAGEGRHGERRARAAPDHRRRRRPHGARVDQPLRRCSCTATRRRSPSCKEFPDRGHSLTVDSGWHDVAGAVVGWLKEKGL